MKILFAFYLASGGVVTLNTYRYHALHNQEMECHFLYLKKGSGTQNFGDMKTFITNENKEIQNIILKENYDVIVVTLDYLFVTRLRKLGYQGKIIYDIQGFGTQIKELFNQLIHHIPHQAEAIMSPKTPHIQKLITHYFPAMKYFSFHNCIHTGIFHYQILPKYNKKIIGWVGRIEPNKNWKYFLQISAELIKVDSNIELWMFEDPLLSSPIERNHFFNWIKKLQLGNNLQIFKNIPHDKMANYYSIIGDSGGFICSTSKKEGFGYAVLEAMSCHCPVLATDSDGVKSLIIHNITGKLISSNNLDTAVVEATELLNNSELKNTLCMNALQHVNSNFTTENYRENFLRMLRILKVYNGDLD